MLLRKCPKMSTLDFENAGVSSSGVNESFLKSTIISLVWTLHPYTSAMATKLTEAQQKVRVKVGENTWWLRKSKNKFCKRNECFSPLFRASRI